MGAGMRTNSLLALFTLVSLASFASVLAAGCGCTAVGCPSQMTITVPGAGATFRSSFPLSVKACVDGTCTSARAEVGPGGEIDCIQGPQDSTGFDLCSFGTNDSLIVVVEAEVENAKRVTLTLADEQGKVLYQASGDDLSVEGVNVNGAMCGDDCHQGAITLPPMSP